MSRQYRIPQDPTFYPEKLWGMQLGNRFRDIKRGTIFMTSYLIDLMIDHGFLMFLVPLLLFLTVFSPFLCLIFTSLFLHFLLYFFFLGTCFKHFKHELEEAGFDCNTHPELKHTARQRYPFEVIKSAFLAYKAIHKDLLVPNKFKVEEGNEAYPKETWGMPLGTKRPLIHLLCCLHSVSYNFVKKLTHHPFLFFILFLKIRSYYRGDDDDHSQWSILEALQA